MTNREKYIIFCNEEPELPIFQQYWWLDAVCGIDKWNSIILENGNGITAVMPYFIEKKIFLEGISMPSLTQFMGPYLKYPLNQKYSKRLSYEKKNMTQLIKKLPEFYFFEQNFNHILSNWLPFYWLGFKQTTRYTYLITNEQDINDFYTKIDSNIRTDIKKAIKNVTVIENDDINTFFEINKMSFSRQKLEPPYDLDLLTKIDECCCIRNCRKILFAEDDIGQIHAAIYLVWDNKSVYYIMGGGNPKYRNSGATSLLIWEGIKFAFEIERVFDFEGSMMQPVEKFVRAFGAVQKPYFAISKTPSRLLRIKKFIRTIIR